MLKKIYSSIPISRLLFYMMVPAFLPLVWLTIHFWNMKQEWRSLSYHIASVQQHSDTKSKKQYLNNLVRQNYTIADHFYVDHQLETMAFLKKEKEALEKFFQSRTYPGDDAAEKRFSFITGEKNRLLLTQGSVQTAEKIRQTVEILSHPIELDATDLNELLNRIEEWHPNQPQLLITQLKLHRKETPNGEVFEAHFKLLKREFES